MAAAMRHTLPTLLASAGTVICAMICLLAAQSASLHGLGPVGALGIISALQAQTTFLPALLVVLGRAAFWPRIPRAGHPGRKGSFDYNIFLTARIREESAELGIQAGILRCQELSLTRPSMTRWRICSACPAPCRAAHIRLDAYDRAAADSYRPGTGWSPAGSPKLGTGPFRSQRRFRRGLPCGRRVRFSGGSVSRLGCAGLACWSVSALPGSCPAG
jgi:hypothetical protein